MKQSVDRYKEYKSSPIEFIHSTNNVCKVSQTLVDLGDMRKIRISFPEVPVRLLAFTEAQVSPPYNLTYFIEFC